jgi:hypothetical protein
LCGIQFYSNFADAPVSKLFFDNVIDPTNYLLYAFADFSWSDCPDTSQSTGGYHIVLQGGIVESATTFPTPVARSSPEAEYMNASIASVAVNAMAMLVQDIQFGDPDQPLRLPMLVDNQACIAISETFQDNKRTQPIYRWRIRQPRI